MNIVVVNSVSLNGGDAAILESLLGAVREQWGDGVHVTVLDSHASIAAKYFPNLRFRPGFQPERRVTSGVLKGKRRWLERRVFARTRFARLLAAAALLRQGLDTGARAFADSEELATLACFRDADLVVSTGGTYLVPNYNLEGRLFEMLLAHVFAVPLVLYTQSIGSLAGTPHAALLTFCLKHAALIALRDEQSRGHLRALGLDGGNIVLCPDSVFAMVDEARLRSVRPMSKDGIEVIVSVRDWAHFENGRAKESMARYRSAVAEAVTSLVRDRGARVRFVSTCQGIPEYDYDDSKIADAVLAEIPEVYRTQVSVDRERHTPTALLEILSRADLVIATRMHMAILALCAGATVLPIAYEFKTQELFRVLGIPDWVEPIELVSAFSLKQRVELVLREADARRPALNTSLLEMKRDAAKVLARVPRLLAEHARRAEPQVNWMWTRVSPEEGFE
jgi:colanic acid/amylovoran biosynthesis protein